jgi:molybdopterin synthase catalytic subunit
MTIRVRLFASLRELAGAAEVPAAGKTVGEVADAVGKAYGERFAKIAAVSSYVLNGDRASRETPVADGDEVAILPPVSGGGPPPLRVTTRSASRPSGPRSPQ